MEQNPTAFNSPPCMWYFHDAGHLGWSAIATTRVPADVLCQDLSSIQKSAPPRLVKHLRPPQNRVSGTVGTPVALKSYCPSGALLSEALWIPLAKVFTKMLAPKLISDSSPQGSVPVMFFLKLEWRQRGSALGRWWLIFCTQYPWCAHCS